MKKRSQREFARLGALARVSLIILASLSLNTCDLLKPGLGDKVDINPPSLAISSPQQNTYVKGTLTVKGTAADDLSLAKVTVRYAGTSGDITKNITVSGGAWTIDIPTGTAGTDNLPDGEQKVTVTATDASGKEVEALLLAYIDNIAPTVLVTVPQGYGASKPIVSDYIDVKGEVWDRSPIVDVDVQLLDAGNSILETKLADGTNTWSTRFITSARPDNQTYKYAIQATDKAGNTNTYYYHSQDIWASLAPGLLFPATDEIGKVDQTQSGTAGNITFAMLQALRIGITGSPKFGDFDKIADATLPILHFSNLDPSLAITSNVIGNKVPITGYVNPGPAGTPVDGTSIKAWIIPSTVTTWPALPNVDAGAVTWTSISSSVSFQIEPKVGGSYISSGRYKVKVSAKSTGSSNTTEITCGFLVDSGAPRIDSVLPDDLSLITRKTFTAGPLGGSGKSGIEIRAHAIDDNAINTFTASSSLTSGGAALPGTASAADSVDPGWYYVQVPLAAGNTDIWFDLQATDDAGTIARRTLHYIIDESAPTVSIDSPIAGSYVTGNSTQISGTASDNTGEVRYIYLWLGLSSATPPADFTTWNRLTGNASWVTTLPFDPSKPTDPPPEGQYTVRAVAVDFAGNQSAVATRAFYLDQANPTLEETSIGPTPAYRNAAFSLSGTAADTNALANITITQKKNGGASTTVLNQALSGKSQAWSWSVPGAETDGTFEYTITVTDVAGRAALPAVSRTVVYDRVKPTVTFTSLTPVIGTNTVNGIVTLTVAVSDTTGLATVWYRYGDSGAFAEITTNKTTPSLVIDTTTFTDIAVTNAWIRAIDLAGNTQEVAQALAVDQSSDKPVISLTNLSAARNTPALGWGNLLESNAKVQGSATDDDSLDSSTIEISVDAAASWAAVSQKGPSGKVVSFEHNIASLAEGMHYLHIQASDLASAKMGLPFASNAIGPVYFVVDKYPPSISVTSPAQDAVVNAGFAISGTASDANGLADLNSDTVSDVEVSTNGGASWTVLGAPGGAWSYPVAVDTSGHTFDGSHTYKFRATDRFAKTTVVDYRFVVDTTGPTVAVSAPAASSWLSGSTSVATGTAADGTGTGVATVYWWAGDSLATPPALLSSWNTATGTTSWSGLMDVSGLGEGNRRLHVKAVDAAGNWSSTVQRDFGIDQANPVLGVTNIGTGVVGRSAIFTMDGTATDTNALANIRVEQKKDAGSPVEIYNQSISGTSQAWSVTGLPRDPSSPASSLLADGLFEYSATLTDVAGRTDVVRRTVQIDTTAPTVTITNPMLSAWLSGSAFTASGTTTDSLSGVASVEWSTNGTTWFAANGTTSWSATLDLATLGEGSKTLYARATDNSGNTSTAVTRNFGIDQSPPTAAVTAGSDVVATTSYYNRNFTVSIDAADTLSLASITITQSYTDVLGSTTNSIPVNAAALTGTGQTYTWTKTVNAGSHADDGTYLLTITVVDGAGKSSAVITRTVVVDTTAPVLDVEGVTSGINSALGQVNGIITFKFGADGGLVTVEKSGPNYVAYYSIVLHDTPVDTSSTGLASWQSVSSSGGRFTFTSDTTAWGASGDYDIYVAARDSIPTTPNVAWQKTIVTMNQDSDRPTIIVTNLTEAAPGPTQIQDEQQQNIFARSATILGNIEDDDGVGPGGVQIRIDANNDGDFSDGGVENWQPVSDQPSSTGTFVSWKHDISALAEGFYRLQARSRDKNSAGDAVYGNPSNYSWKESPVIGFSVDFGPPQVTVSTPVNGVIQTADFAITGTAVDALGISAVTIKIDGGAEVAVTDTAVSPAKPFSTWSYTYTVAGHDGVHPYQVKATTSGLPVDTILDKQFVVDVTPPATTINTPQASEITNGTLQISGTASDNYQLANVYYSIGAQGAAAPDYRGPDATWGTGDDWTGWTALNLTYSWQFNLNTTTKTDGNYTVHMMGLDTAGNAQAGETTRDFTINQASDKPVVAVTTLKESGTYQENLLPNTLQVAGTVSDDDAVKGSSIQVAVDANGNGLFTDPGDIDWTVVSPAVLDGRVVTWANTFSGLTDGSFELYVRAGDINDSGYGTFTSGQIGPVKFSVDTAAPSGSVTYPAPGAFLNSYPGFDIIGTATDANGIKSVQIKVGAASPVAVIDTAVSPAKPFSTWKYTYTYTSDMQVSYQIIITDVFDKVSTIDRYFTMDRTKPTVAFIQPTSGYTANGSLLVRGTASDTNQVTGVWYAIDASANPAPVWPNDGLGVEYTQLAGTFNWQKRIRTTDFANGSYKIWIVSIDNAGNASDPANGVLPVSFNSTQNVPVVTIATADNTLLDNSGTITGTVTDDDGVNPSSIMIKIGTAPWVAVTSTTGSGTSVSFSHSIAGLAEQKNPYSVQVEAYDVGENFDGGDFSGPDDIAPVSATASISIKKDDGAPTAAITDLNNGLLTVTTLQGVYLKDRLTLNGTATDGVEVGTVEARILALGTEPFEAVTNMGTHYSTWTWSKTGLSLSGSSVNLEMRVTDYHARVTTYAYTLLVDTTAPTAAIDTPSANPATATGAYNGTVIFRGSAADGVKVEKVYYRWGTSAAAQPNGTYTGWTEAASTYSWTTAALDTYALYGDEADHTYHLSALSVDSAGNESPVQDVSFNINQGSDRPALSVSAPTAAQVFGPGAKAAGTVADDDGLSSIEVRIDTDGDADFADGGLEDYAAVSSPATVSGTSVSFEHNLAGLADGFYKIQIRVRDTGWATVPAGQKALHERESAVIDFSNDTAPPALSLTKITVQDRYSGPAREITSNFSGSYINNDSTFTFNASDASGIASVELSTDNGSSWNSATHGSGNEYTYALTVPLNQSFDGTRNIQYRATDINSKVTSGIVTLIVDTAEPVISFTNPAGVSTNPATDAPNVNGDVIVQGTVSDSSAVTGVAITGGLADQIALTNTGNAISWKVTLAGSGTYANATYSTDQGGNIWRLPVKVTATEFAGNRTITTGYIDIDPDSDRPVVNVVSPSPGDSVTGVFLINGTVVDDDGAQSVRLQIDLNNDGVYGVNGGFNGKLDLNNDSDYTDDFEDETVYKTVTVTNGAWSIPMNGSGELNKSNLVARGLATADGHISFRVTPVDIYGTLGTAQTQTLYIDADAPIIKGLATDGVTEVPAPTPATGTLQKGTITLRALFKDDRDLLASGMQISFDGGSNYQAINTVAGATITDLGTTNPYQYRIVIPIDTTTVVSGGNGTLQISLKVTDKTYKQTTQTVQYSVDNTLPEVAWNLPATLSYQGSIPNEIYSFFGSGSTINNEVFGKASDSGTISGIAKVNVYFVKGGNFINPKTGATVAVSNQTVRESNLDRNGDGDYTDPYEYVGTDHSIPFTEDSNLVITIDKRTELGQFDSNPTLGDQDGFNESLKAKSGYDEWYAYFDSTKLPDGPIDVYFVAYDEAGNRVYDKAIGQVTNNPPSITGFTVGGQPLTGNPVKVKYSNTVSLQTYADDSGGNAGTVASSWLLTVAHRYGAQPGGDVDLGNEKALTPFYYGVNSGGNWIRDFDPKSGSTPSSATVDINTRNDGFVDGDWYLLTVQVTDNDGNVAAKNLYLRVNNSDTTPPTATIDDFTQTSVGMWSSGQGPLNTDIAAGNINTGTDVLSVALPSWITNGTKVMFAGASAPGGFSPATVYYVINNTGSTFQLSATSGGAAVDITSASGTYDLVCGGHVEDAADSNNDGNDADLSGAVIITGTVFDSTDVSTLHVEIDGVDQGTAALSNKTGDAVLGYTYNWTYVWDTAKQGMALVAKDNVVVRVYGIDPANNFPAAGSRPTKTVDVVPYITSVTDPNGLSTDVLRGATGKYSISSHATNTLTVRGYNLGSSGVTPAAWVSPTAANPTAGTAPGTTWISSNEVRVSKNLTRSGYLTVLVSTVPSINNVTRNDRARNIETTADPRSAQWTDDRYLWVWATTQVSLATLNGTGANVNNLTYYNPEMVMNGDQPEFAFNDENNGITVYTTSDTVATRRTGYRLTRPAGYATATVSAVLQRFIATSFDSTWTTSGDNTGFLEVTGFGNQTTDGNGQTNGPSVMTDGGVNWPTIQGIDYYAPNDETIGTYRNVNRFPHPKMIAATSNPNTGANIWLAYHDSNIYHKSLNFVSFRMTGTGANGANLITAPAGYIRSPDVVEIPGTTVGASSEYFGMTKIGANGIAIAYYDANAGRLKLAYNANAYNSTGVAATENLTNTGREESLVTLTNGTKTNYCPAANGSTSLKYFTIYGGGTSYDVFYDNTPAQNAVRPAGSSAPNTIRVNINAIGNGTAGIITQTITAIRTAVPAVFEVQRQVNNTSAMYIIPFGTGNTTDISSNLATGTNVGSSAKVRDGGASTWSILTLDSSADVGQYVSIVSDGASKLYIAYYDFDNANLKMARVSWNAGSPALDQIVNIDNYLSAGTWTNIMLLNNTNLTGQASLQPVIACYSDSYNGTKKPIRFAFPLFDATTGTMSNGTTGGGGDDQYSGSWEVVTVPTITNPQGGAATFNRVNLSAYSSNTLPVIGWLGTKLEYAKLQPNN